MRAIKNSFSIVILCICFSCISLVAKADPDPWDDEQIDVPIDGGLSLLIAAGLMIGVKKGYNCYQDRRAKNKVN